jgi:hypothetical protein
MRGTMHTRRSAPPDHRRVTYPDAPTSPPLIRLARRGRIAIRSHRDEEAMAEVPRWRLIGDVRTP